jgi:hypothetical protein
LIHFDFKGFGVWVQGLALGDFGWSLAIRHSTGHSLGFHPRMTPSDGVRNFFIFLLAGCTRMYPDVAG